MTDKDGGMTDPSTLEHALAGVDADIDRALKTAAALLKELQRTKRAAGDGTVKDLRRLLEAARDSARSVGEAIEVALSGWQFDTRGYLASGAYAAELRRAAESRGVRVFEQDGRLIAYPHVLQFHPADLAVALGATTDRRLRPSAFAERLLQDQTRPPRSDGRQILETFFAAYQYLVPVRDGARQFGATVALTDLHGLLTLTPEQRKQYGDAEFVRDVSRLDVEGPTVTKGGYRMTLPASTGTRTARALSTVTPDGIQRLYFGIAFQPVSDGRDD